MKASLRELDILRYSIACLNYERVALEVKARWDKNRVSDNAQVLTLSLSISSEGQMARGSEFTRLKDIASLVGVSTMTVSRALRGVEGVSIAKRAEIQKIARYLNYTPNLPAKAMAQANSALVGVSFPTLYNDVFSDMLLGMRSVFERESIATIVSTTDYSATQELAWVQRLIAWRPAGLVLTGSEHSTEIASLVHDAKVPVVEIWAWRNDPIDMCVGIDHREAGFTLGRKLRNNGYRKPGYIGNSIGVDGRAEARLHGLMEAFDCDVPAGRSGSRNAFRAGYDGCAALMSFCPQLDVIFALNDHVAYGGWMYLQSIGLTVPGDMGLVGFNGLGLLDVLPVKLTSMRTPREQMGRIAAQSIVGRCQGVTKPVRIKLKAEFIPGQTILPFVQA